MAIEITSDLTQISGANSVTNWSGTPNTPALNTEMFKEGTGSMGIVKLSEEVQTTKFDYYTENGSTYLDVSADTTVYIWGNVGNGGGLNTFANGGVRIYLEDLNGYYSEWYVAGSDTYPGGWKRFAASTGVAADYESNASFDLTQIRYIGIVYDMLGRTTANVQNAWVDSIDYGWGLIVKGGTSSVPCTIADIFAGDEAIVAGIVSVNEGVYVLQGDITVPGDSTQDTYFEDSSQMIVGANLSIPSYNIVIGGDATYDTTFILNGSFLKTNGPDMTFTAIDVNITACDVDGCTFVGFGLIKFSSTSSVSGTVFDGCLQIDPGLGVFEGISIKNSVATDGSLYWPSDDTNISDVTFSLCDNDIEIDASSDATPTFANIVHDDNAGDYDVNNTSGGAVTVAMSGTSNGNSYNPGGSAVTFSSSATLILTVKDVNGDPVGSAYAYIDDNNETPFIMNTTTNVTTGIATVAWTGGAVADATWRVRKYGYKPYTATADVPASGTKDIPVTLIADPQQT